MERLYLPKTIISKRKLDSLYLLIFEKLSKISPTLNKPVHQSNSEIVENIVHWLTKKYFP